MVNSNLQMKKDALLQENTDIIIKQMKSQEQKEYLESEIDVLKTVNQNLVEEKAELISEKQELLF